MHGVDRAVEPGVTGALPSAGDSGSSPGTVRRGPDSLVAPQRDTSAGGGIAGAGAGAGPETLARKVAMSRQSSRHRSSPAAPPISMTGPSLLPPAHATTRARGLALAQEWPELLLPAPVGLPRPLGLARKKPIVAS
mmetsp:Transcript_9667/g.30715  ORF Transcript_9667/g.30715 Transcript_9667/m.30715 type:complete len:136 (-) Transcript_9667:1148-1555(-)